jgi:allantoin racemase
VRVIAITPIHVSDEELARRQRRYDSFAGAHLAVTVANLPPDAPRQLADARDIAASDELVAERARQADPDRFDAVLPDCVLDPGVERLRADGTGVRIHGITELSAGYLAALAHPFAAVARNKAIADELDARIRAYGLGRALAGVHVLDLSFDDIADDARWHAALDGVRAQLPPGVAAVFNGCSAVDVRRGGPPTVVDPTRLALRLLAFAAIEQIL